MRVDLHSLDPWAQRRPRRSDWFAAALGLALLIAGGATLWQSAGSSAAVAADDRVDATDWQQTLQRSERLNRVIGDLSRPWSRWLERSLALAGPGVRLERFDGEPQAGRMEIVVTAPDLGRGVAFVSALDELPGVSAAQLARHEMVRDGVRVQAEVTLR